MSNAPKPLPEGVRLHALVEHCEKRMRRAHSKLQIATDEADQSLEAFRSSVERQKAWAEANPEPQQEMF